MVHKMPGQHGSVRTRKRKSNSRKATRRRCAKSPKTHPAAVSTSAVSGCSKTDDPLERLSLINCECHQSAGRRRCSASPELEGQEGKENQLSMDLDSCRGNGIWYKQESEDMDCDETRKNIFPDDDSNQILPVEQFFGNLDALQDFPQRSSATSTRGHREHRRRYYAPEDSDEDEAALSSMQPDDRGDT